MWRKAGVLRAGTEIRRRRRRRGGEVGSCEHVIRVRALVARGQDHVGRARARAGSGGQNLVGSCRG